MGGSWPNNTHQRVEKDVCKDWDKTVTGVTLLTLSKDPYGVSQMRRCWLLDFFVFVSREK